MAQADSKAITKIAPPAVGATKQDELASARARLAVWGQLIASGLKEVYRLQDQIEAMGGRFDDIYHRR